MFDDIIEKEKFDIEKLEKLENIIYQYRKKTGYYPTDEQIIEMSKQIFK